MEKSDRGRRHPHGAVAAGEAAAFRTRTIREPRYGTDQAPQAVRCGPLFEGPRWHNGRLWFVDCMERTLLSLGPSGEREQHTKFADDTPCGLGILPDGKVVALTMFRKRLMVYADLTGIATVRSTT